MPRAGNGKCFFKNISEATVNRKNRKKPMSQIECWVPRHLPVRLDFFGFFGFFRFFRFFSVFSVFSVFVFLVEYQGPVLESVFSKKCPKQP